MISDEDLAWIASVGESIQQADSRAARLRSSYALGEVRQHTVDLADQLSDAPGDADDDGTEPPATPMAGKDA